jgi:hypothetical protein
MDQLRQTQDQTLNLEVLLDSIGLQEVREDTEDVLGVASLLKGHQGSACVVP